MGINILITGGAGFIGRNLIEYLLNYYNKHIDKIICVDNFISSNKADFTKFYKKVNEMYNNKVILFEFDISESRNYKQIFPNIAEIYHLASIASPVYYKKYPLQTLNIGYNGTLNMLELARQSNAKILFSSTSEVYGDPNISPQNEDYLGNVNSFGIRSSYDESKRVAEALCYTYINTFNVDVKIARIFNTYGEYMQLNDGRIVTETIKNLLYDTTLTIYGDGTQTRSCCYVFDTVDMLVKLMGSNCNIPVNIGNNEELTVNEIVNRIEKIYNTYFLIMSNEVKLKIQYVALTQNDPLIRKPCLKRNKEILGNRDYFNLEDGIFNTITYMLHEMNSFTPLKI